MPKFNISLVAPIRNNTKEFERLMNSLIENTTNSKQNVEFVLVIDDDDKEMQELQHTYKKKYDAFNLRFYTVYRSEHFVRDYYNFAALQAQGRFILAITIDVVFKTKGWDKIIFKSMEVASERFGDDCLYGIVHDGLPRSGNSEDEQEAKKNNKALWHAKVDFSCWILMSRQFVQLYGGMMDTRNWLWGADHWTGLTWQEVKGGQRIVMIRDVLIDHISYHVKDLPQPESFKYFCQIMERHPMIYNNKMVKEEVKKINEIIDSLHEKNLS